MTTLRITIAASWLLAAPAAIAQDECSTDEECVAYYGEGFVCLGGGLGRYCEKPSENPPDDYGYDYDAGDYYYDYGYDSDYEPDEPKNDPVPFRSCSASAPDGRPSAGLLWLLFGLLVVTSSRRS